MPSACRSRVRNCHHERFGWWQWWANVQVTGAAFTGGPAGDNLGEEGTAMKTYKPLDASVQPTTPGAEQTIKPPVSSVSSVPGDVGTSQRLTSFLHLNISSADSQIHPPSSAPSIVASGAGTQQLAGSPVPAPRRDAQVLIGKEAPAPTSNLSMGLQPGAEPAVLTTTYSTGSCVRPESGVPVAALDAGTQWQLQSAVQVPATGAGPQLQQGSAVHVPAAYAGPRLHQMPATMSYSCGTPTPARPCCPSPHQVCGPTAPSDVYSPRSCCGYHSSTAAAAKTSHQQHGSAASAS